MYPVIYDFGSWKIRSYDAVLCLAIVIGMFMVWHEAKKAGYPGRRMVLCLVGTVICAVLGARINGWLFWFHGNIAMLNLNVISTGNGMTAFGGLAGALGFAALYSYWNHWNVLKLLDIVALTLALTEGIQRIGCFLNGCCYGRETTGFLGIYLPDTLGHWAYRYPSQIITGIFCFTLFVLLWKQRRNKSFEGSLMLYYLVVYNVGRVVIDFLRGDEPVVLGLLTAHQLTAAAIASIAAIVLYFKLNQRMKTLRPVELEDNVES
jgi:phosphatidylglycerol:prolipoprotein diacylglycerol transferase